MNKSNYISFESQRKLDSYLTNNCRVKCKCGHSMLLFKEKDKIICTYCGNYIFKDKKTEFEYRIKEKMNGGIEE